MDDREAKRFYDSAAWKHKRSEILQRDHYECQDCRARVMSGDPNLASWQRHINQATQVHHLIELKARPDLALDSDNLISLCANCHNLRHGREPVVFHKKKKPVTVERW